MVQFSGFSLAIVLPSVLTSKTVQVDTSPLSKMKVITAMGYLKKHKTTGSDRLSPSFFKDWRSFSIPGFDLEKRTNIESMRTGVCTDDYERCWILV